MICTCTFAPGRPIVFSADCAVGDHRVEAQQRDAETGGDHADLFALMAVIHCVTHPDCSNPDCIDGIYTDEDTATAILAAGWRPPARVIQTDEDFESLPNGTIIHIFQSEQDPTLALIQPGRDENG